ncbi:DUF3106 domain-containing protein [uncultured Piscinibacter sp.]|uniref:DUF3106 domain-containing protein n=1 Tax=uncultured Piscinibacter sp. TaxID=1131835 RepID=UPI002603CF32|nr:DUF3106 domain-containing protein [uncultured Piscinibacter sp.]
MSPLRHHCTWSVPRALLLCVFAAVGAWAAGAAQAQHKVAGRVPVVAGAESGPGWQDLSPSQRAALKPLEREWSSIDASGKQKWLEIVARYPSLPPAEQQRISGRMAEWVKMSPSQRGQARMNFQSARQLTAEERQARWKAYQALTPEQRSRLAARAAPGAAPAARSAESSRRPPPSSRDAVQSKSNIVPNPSYAGSPRPIGPSVVQGAPGATTSLISKRPAPPTHQQPGLPKIAATPGFVDKQTLLPQRGAQGAAAITPPSSPASRR